jgi:hypothetical protein
MVHFAGGQKEKVLKWQDFGHKQKISEYEDCKYLPKKEIKIS